MQCSDAGLLSSVLVISVSEETISYHRSPASDQLKVALNFSPVLGVEPVGAV